MTSESLLGPRRVMLAARSTRLIDSIVSQHTLREPLSDPPDKNDKQKKTKETDDPAGRRPSSRSPLANSVFVSAISIPLSHVAANTLSLFFKK